MQQIRLPLFYNLQEINGQKNNFIFFWGYRTHVIVSKEGIPLVSVTLPNNFTDAKIARKLIKKLKRSYGLKKGSFFIADAAYDERELYNFIINQLKCQAFIPINPSCSCHRQTRLWREILLILSKMPTLFSLPFGSRPLITNFAELFISL